MPNYLLRFRDSNGRVDSQIIVGPATYAWIKSPPPVFHPETKDAIETLPDDVVKEGGKVAAEVAEDSQEAQSRAAATQELQAAISGAATPEDATGAKEALQELLDDFADDPLPAPLVVNQVRVRAGGLHENDRALAAWCWSSDPHPRAAKEALDGGLWWLC